MAEYFADEASDDRAVFANISFGMLYQKFQGNFSSVTFQNEAKQLAMYFDEYVRNIYEIEDEIPMMAWVNFLKHGFDESRWDEGEKTAESWQSEIFVACHHFYA